MNEFLKLFKCLASNDIYKIMTQLDLLFNALYKASMASMIIKVNEFIKIMTQIGADAGRAASATLPYAVRV